MTREARDNPFIVTVCVRYWFCRTFVSGRFSDSGATGATGATGVAGTPGTSGTSGNTVGGGSFAAVGEEALQLLCRSFCRSFLTRL